MYRIDIVIPEQKKPMSNYLHYKSSLVNYFGFLRAHTSRLCLSNSPMMFFTKYYFRVLPSQSSLSVLEAHEEISHTLYGDRDAERETWKERKHISLTISYSSPSTTSPNIYTDHGLWYSDDENHKLRNNSNKTFKRAFILHMFFTLCFWINVPWRHDHRHQISTFSQACCSEPPYLRSFPVVNII